MLDRYLTALGLSDKERAIYLALAEVGIQPASVIARRCGFDRITTYKCLKKLSDRGLVQTYFRDSIQCFGIESFDAIESFLKERLFDAEDLLGKFPTAAQVLKSLREGDDQVPQLQLFDGEAGMKSLLRDMLFEAKQQQILQIRMLSSNTFEDWQRDPVLARAMQEFLAAVNRKDISIQLFEATGGIVPERLQHVSVKDPQRQQLSFARGMTSVFLVGHCVYLTCYKGSATGLKIKQADVSQIFHFMFDLLSGSMKATSLPVSKQTGGSSPRSK